MKFYRKIRPVSEDVPSIDGGRTVQRIGFGRVPRIDELRRPPRLAARLILGEIERLDAETIAIIEAEVRRSARRIERKLLTRETVDPFRRALDEKTLSEIDEELDRFGDRMGSVIETKQAEAAALGFRSTSGMIDHQAGRIVLDSSFEIGVTRNTLEGLAGIRADLIRRVPDALRSAIRQDLVEGLISARSVRDVRRMIERTAGNPSPRLLRRIGNLALKRLRETAFARWESRAERIARTEVLRAKSTATQLTEMEIERRMNRKLSRTWLAFLDERTRWSHVAANGQTVVGTDVPFRVGESRLLFPHDPNGPAAETINCRCTVISRLLPP